METKNKKSITEIKQKVKIYFTKRKEKHTHTKQSTWIQKGRKCSKIRNY